MSQFRSKPIIRVDIEAHREESTDFPIILRQKVMETLAHEYGHVIEEFVRASENKTMLNRLLSQFDDMEDFAESFSCWVNKKTLWLSDKQQEVLKDVVTYYVDNSFLDEAIVWVRQDKWKRNLDYVLDHNEKAFSKYQTPEKAFNRCIPASETLAEKLINFSSMDIQILRLEGYKGNLKEAHPQWKKLGGKWAVHYVVMLEKEHIVDLTAKQFDPNHPSRFITTREAIGKLWVEQEVHKDYTISTPNKPFKMK